MIKTVIRIKNNMVLVFDENGEEMPIYQGYYDDVKKRILADAWPDSVFSNWFGYSFEAVVVSPEAW